ncbi:MAG TPA: choice-of-anchor tandem repeat GloVer-containing protein [Vicinamibacterales bacterium]|nr:choice-of-anchor tandem repeat GloVer-containing protein [Vicinamibacterales bacterium]
MIAAAGICLLCPSAVLAQTHLEVVHSFSSADGGRPDTTVIQAADGNFYGVTGFLRPANVFKVTPGGDFSIFAHVSLPVGRISTTADGGILVADTPSLVKFDLLGNATPLTPHQTCGGLLGVLRTVTVTRDGRTFGTTGGPGSSFCGASWLQGAIFEMLPSGDATIIQSFNYGQPGGSIQDLDARMVLIQASDDRLYGTTAAAGDAGLGTVFRFTEAGNFEVVHTFVGGNDGARPIGGVTEARDGTLFGTTSAGGSLGKGTVFRMTANGDVTIVHAFSGPDGAGPSGGLILGSDGNLYGMTSTGGPANAGTIFSIAPDGTFTSLYAFTLGNDGGFPFDRLTQARDGSLYGVTLTGGAFQFGTIFHVVLTPPDTTPPTTTAALTPVPNAAGWNNDSVSVALSAIDPGAGSSGVRQITYSVSGAQSVPATSVAGDTVTVPISAEGLSTLTFFATDVAGNMEAANTLLVRVDRTAPTLEGSRAPAANANDWTNTPVTVTFSCSDALSGVAFSNPDSVIVSAEGHGQSVDGTCSDVAGNEASTTVGDINIDITPPAISARAAAATLWPPNGKLVADVISGSVSDVLSGLDPATATFRVVDSYGAVQPTGTFLVRPDGSYSFTIMLEAARRGDDPLGRQYQVVINARDRAGNAASASTVVTVPHDRR